MSLLPAPSPTMPVDERVTAAALRCVARWGVAKTGLDDVAREAGVSRATVYRSFPGGKDALIAATVAAEIDRFRTALAHRVASATTLEGVLVAAVHEAGRRLVGHPALAMLLAHEPGLVLPHMSFAGMDRLLAAATEMAAPWLSPWLAAPDARRTAEWVARLVLSYASCPADEVDLTDEASVRNLVKTFVLPGLSVTSSLPVSPSVSD